MTIRFLLLWSALLLAGCAGVTDVSNQERVRGYVGQSTVLRRPMLLIGRSGYFFGGANDVAARRHVRYGLSERGMYQSPRVFAELSPGHRITVDAIQEEVYFDADQTVVYGRTIFPATGREVGFAYVCAPLRSLQGEALPWEQ